MPKRITTDEWRAELHRMIAPQDDPGESVEEMSIVTGRSPRAIRREISVKLRAGEIVQGWAMRTNAVGSKVRIPVYRPAP
jgi:hypothetical protein